MTSFGQQLLACSTIAQAYELERADGRGERFAALDELVSELAGRSLRGEKIVVLSIDEIRGDSIEITGLSPAQANFIKEYFDYDRQRERGSWSLPDKDYIDAGRLNLADNFSNVSQFPVNYAEGEICRVKLETSPEAVFLRSVFSPFIEKITHPISLKSMLAGTYELDELKTIWHELDEFYSLIGISEVEELRIFRPKGGWSKLTDRAAQRIAKKDLLTALSKRISVSAGSLYRHYTQRELIEQYYKKAKTGGIIKRKQVITKAFQTPLTGFFGGDWLALVDYLGERPHPDEQIVTALPKPQIYAGGATRATKIAEQHGVSQDEVEKIAAALWQKPSGASPIEERTECLKKYWQEFDNLHSRQKPGMKSLWGLVEEGERIDFETERDEIFHPGLCLQLLSAELTTKIETLWGTTVLNKYPESIVSEPFPHYVMAKVLGPALFFWQNCALTAWFLCEGPYSRTDMEGLAHHQRCYLAELEGMETPVAPEMFAELIEQEKRLGPEERIESEKSSSESNFGITFSISVSTGARRAGFEKLRDVITRHRRAWTNKYFEKYLKNRWESEVTAAANSFFLKMSEKGGKPPTVKQFVSTAAPPARSWFGGDISLLYTAIGEKVPFQSRKSLLMPVDKAGFVEKVSELLPSRDFDYFGRAAGEYIQKQYIDELARKSLNFIQIYEAIGRLPTLKEFATKFKPNSAVLHDDETLAWEIYVSAAKEALQWSLAQPVIDYPKAISQNERSVAAPSSEEIKTSTPIDNLPIPVAKAEEQTVEVQIIQPVNRTAEQHEAPKRRSWLDRLLGRK